jgi:hypothetical protein
MWRFQLSGIAERALLETSAPHLIFRKIPAVSGPDSSTAKDLQKASGRQNPN